MNRTEYIALLEKNLQLMESKHEDYGSDDEKSQTALGQYFPFDDKSYVQMLHVKTLRLVSLVGGNKIPNHERVEDTVRDLINYGVYYLDYLMNKVE